MSLLVLSLPWRQRPPPPVAAAAPSPQAAASLAAQAEQPSLAWAFSADGRHLERHGHAPLGQWPRADTVVAVLPAPAVAWHRPILPRAPRAKLRAALAGVLEEQLLGDEADAHFALAPDATPGQPAWVAATDKPWLTAWLAALRDAGFPVDKLVAAATPTTLAGARAPGGADGGAGWLHLALEGQAGQGTEAERLMATFADDSQCLSLPTTGSLFAAWAARACEAGAALSATPAAARAAEQALAAAVPEAAAPAVVDEPQALLAAAAQPWSLLQFDLRARHRGLRALGPWWPLWRSPAWRPARWGLAALALVQLIGLNAHAWQQRRALAESRAAMESLLRKTHPQVRAVLDAPAQMQRETERLRLAAGQPQPQDWDVMLAALARHWPAGAPQPAQWRYADGRLSWPAAGWLAPQLQSLRAGLAEGGLQLSEGEGRLWVQPQGLDKR